MFLAILGPGIITANVDNDAGGITTYSLAGAQFGNALLWTLLPIGIALIVMQEMGARMGAITGKGLADLIRENFGVKVTFFLMVAMILVGLGNTCAEFSGVAASLEIYGISRYISVPLGAFAVWLLVIKGSYRRVEKVFLFACVVYLSYILSGIMAKPDWGTVLSATVRPSFSFDGKFLAMLIALVGTSIAPWMQFYLQSAVVDKGVTRQDYKYSRLDVIVGCIGMIIVAFFIVASCSATLFANHIEVKSAADAAEALKPLAGKYCAYLFAFGLFNASLFAASILPLSTAYFVCEGMGWERGVDRTLGEAPQFYGLYTAIIALGAAIILWPNAPLLGVMFWSQVLNGVTLAPVLILVLLLINRKDLMGEWVNGKIFNWIAWITTVLMIALTLVLVFQMVLGGG
ncbi:MAG TPA: Nramp family divalent metal transporter [Armatimonadota bacterium]|jgi:NRAMP (natural resistance-associated macrophage protein)-like metal ion transporter